MGDSALQANKHCTPDDAYAPKSIGDDPLAAWSDMSLSVWRSTTAWATSTCSASPSPITTTPWMCSRASTSSTRLWVLRSRRAATSISRQRSSVRWDLYGGGGGGECWDLLAEPMAEEMNIEIWLHMELDLEQVWLRPVWVGVESGLKNDFGGLFIGIAKKPLKPMVEACAPLLAEVGMSLSTAPSLLCVPLPPWPQPPYPVSSMLWCCLDHPSTARSVPTSPIIVRTSASSLRVAGPDVTRSVWDLSSPALANPLFIVLFCFVCVRSGIGFGGWELQRRWRLEKNG